MARPLRIEYAGTKHDIHKLVPGLTGWTQVNGRDEHPIPEKVFDNTPWRPEERLPIAKELGEVSLMFLVHPTLTQDEITKTTDAIQQVMSNASMAQY